MIVVQRLLIFFQCLLRILSDSSFPDKLILPWLPSDPIVVDVALGHFLYISIGFYPSSFSFTLSSHFLLYSLPFLLSSYPPLLSTLLFIVLPSLPLSLPCVTRHLASLPPFLSTRKSPCSHSLHVLVHRVYFLWRLDNNKDQSITIICNGTSTIEGYYNVLYCEFTYSSSYVTASYSWNPYRSRDTYNFFDRFIA